jgi:hypothetical protein
MWRCRGTGDGSFEPAIVAKRQRRLSGIDETVLSLYARGLTTGDIAAHFAQIYGAQVESGGLCRRRWTAGSVRAPAAKSMPRSRR